MATLADDSGLEVAALAGDPGVRSARYGADKFADKIALLLKAIVRPDSSGVRGSSARLRSQIVRAYRWYV